ncbi:MAG: HAD hydrolase family protein [Clostridia bacterium]|nr:HAD hydrolase family protein [Clostridia bacterium]
MKIICTDYDGTLNHGGITEEKLSAIKKWKEKGNLFCVVSGRQKEFFEEIRKKEIPIDYLLACNGAVIVDKNCNIVSDERCDGDIALPLINFIFSLGGFFAAICNDKHISVDNLAFPDAEGMRLSETGEIPYFNQISTALPDFEDSARVTARIREEFGEYVNPLQNGTCIDIVPRGMDKAQGIYKLLSLVGGEKADVIAVGDNVNDEAMIKEFYSYAMENGVASVKGQADRITVSIEELIEKELQK